MHSESLKLYWSTSKPNVGDWLSPLIVASLTAKEVVHSPARQCEMMALGSILQKTRNHWWSKPVDVWGSGFIEDCKPAKSKHRIHAVRGKLTRERLLGHEHVALGDPGLLTSRIFSQYSDTPKRYNVGVVPHYLDADNSAVKAFVASFPGATFLDIFSDVEKFIHHLSECQCILSSAMHPLIIADSLGIPNQWLVLSDKVEGAGFKFRDYYSIFDMDCPDPMDLTKVGEADLEALMEGYRRPGLEAAVDAIAEAFPSRWR